MKKGKGKVSELSRRRESIILLPGKTDERLQASGSCPARNDAEG